MTLSVVAPTYKQISRASFSFFLSDTTDTTICKKKNLSQLQALIATEKLNTTDGLLQLVLKIFTLVLGLSLLNESKSMCVCVRSGKRLIGARRC